MSAAASAAIVLFLAGALLRLGGRRVRRTKSAIALAVLAVHGILLARFGSAADGGRSFGASLGLDPLSVFTSYALLIALALATIALARRGTAEALSSTFLVAAALGLAVASRDWAWFFASVVTARLLVAAAETPRASKKPRSSASLSGASFLAFAAIALALAILAFGSSTGLVRLAIAGTGSSLAAGLGVAAAVLAVGLSWLDLNAAAWRLSMGLTACASVSLGASLAAGAILVRATSGLAELSLPRPAALFLLALGAAAALAGGVGALTARGPRPLLSRLAVAHAGLAAMSLTMGVSGRAFALLLLVASHAALLGAGLAWDLRAGDDEHEVFPRARRSEVASTALLGASFASLAALPPLPGFVAKLGVLDALASEGGGAGVVVSMTVALASSALVALACLGALRRAGRPEPGEAPAPSEPGMGSGWACLAIGVALATALGLGVFPGAVIELLGVAVAGYF